MHESLERHWNKKEHEMEKHGESIVKASNAIYRELLTSKATLAHHQREMSGCYV